MHWRVLLSQCKNPIPNLKSAPRKAISSVTIWPVLRNATDSGPWARLISFKRSQKRIKALSQSIDSNHPEALFRSSGVVARSRARSGVNASQPFGQAIPRLTG
jgi:hypothetical protein